VTLANDWEYGLSGSVWTSHLDAGIEVSGRIPTGQVRINGAAVAVDAPLCGFKQSGIGREYGPEGLAS
jgi:acyl-CoA reductase-like NAD-dependent aldehyde dehydrogenase